MESDQGDDADSRKYLALASVCAESGAIPVVVCKKGNVVWPKAEVREWCESWGLKTIKMCSCKFGFDFHAWIGTLHVTTEFFSSVDEQIRLQAQEAV